MIKLFTCLLITSLLLLMTLRSWAYAHVLQAEAEIGAILHIIPDDNPISGEPVEYILSFQDITNRFSLYECDCFASYIVDGKIIATNPLNANYSTDSLNSYIFPEPAVYTLEISGKPKSAGMFQAFKLDYIVRVSSGDIKAQGFPLILLVGILGVIGIFLLAASTMDKSYLDPNAKQKKSTRSRPK